MYCVMLEDCQRPHQYFVKMHLSVLVAASFGCTHMFWSLYEDINQVGLTDVSCKNENALINYSSLMQAYMKI